MPDIDKIKKVLEYEYGFLLERLHSTKSVSIKEIDVRLMQVGNESYHSKVDNFEMYKDYDLPIAVCSKLDDKYKIIDGYHRYAAAMLNKKDFVKIIVLE